MSLRTGIIVLLIAYAVFWALCIHGAVEEYPEPDPDWDGAFLDELSDVRP